MIHRKAGDYERFTIFRVDVKNVAFCIGLNMSNSQSIGCNIWKNSQTTVHVSKQSVGK